MLNKWQVLTAGQVSEPILVGQGPLNSLGGYNISVQGTFSGQLVLERRFRGDSYWNLVAAFSSAIETCGVEAEAQTEYRFNGLSLTAGTVRVRLGQ